MNKPMESYNQFDVVKVPFPFVDKNTTKRRPALILTPTREFNIKVGASILAMITSKKAGSQMEWPTDIEIEDLETAGLPFPSLIRLKLFTLDHRIIIGRLGNLHANDRKKVQHQLHQLFCSRTS